MQRTQGSRSACSAILWALTLTGLLVACGEPVATPEPIYLKATGSMAMTPVLVDLATAFHERNPTVILEVEGLGSQFGLEALYAGEVDMASVSWLPAQPGPDWRVVAIARDGVVVVVHASNPVEGLGLLQLQDLFSGRVHDWIAVSDRGNRGGVQPVSRERGSGARVAFESLVMDDLEVTPLAVLVSSSPAVIEYVASHPGAIGYVALSEVSLEVKLLKVEGESATLEGVGEGSYPLTRELWLVTADPPPEALQAFLDFALSPAGQQIVGRHLGRIQ